MPVAMYRKDTWPWRVVWMKIPPGQFKAATSGNGGLIALRAL